MIYNDDDDDDRLKTFICFSSFWFATFRSEIKKVPRLSQVFMF